MKRFFDRIPREILEAARIDGAGPFRLFVSVVLPMSKPILGVVSIFAVLASWKDFLWPLLVLTDASQAAAIGSLANDPRSDGTGGLPRRDADRLYRPDRRLPVPPTLVPRGTGLSGALKG